MLPRPVKWLAAAILLLGGIRPAVAGDTALEFAVKAAFVYKFAPYVQWPATADGDAFTLCVQGDDKVGGMIDEAAAGEQVAGRPIRIVHVANAAPEAGCELLYAAGPDTKQVLEALSDAPVLTVTDADRNPDAHAIIGFTVRDGRVRFVIDQTAAERAGLVISSKLLALAYAVRREDRP